MVASATSTIWPPWERSVNVQGTVAVRTDVVPLPIPNAPVGVVPSVV
jgi:hypothetical protein